jgi:hypothetical protein
MGARVRRTRASLAVTAMPDRSRRAGRAKLTPAPVKPGSETSGKEDHVRPVHSAQAARRTLLVLTVLALALLALIIKPFASALFVAAVIAGALHP